MTSVPPSGAGSQEGGTAPEEIEFRLDEEIVAGVPVLHLAGEVDLAAAPAVRERLTALARQLGRPSADGAARVVVIDLAGVTFIDSTGLSMLVAAHSRFDESSDELRVAAVPNRVRRVLELTGLDGLLRTYDDVPSALDPSPAAGS